MDNHETRKAKLCQQENFFVPMVFIFCLKFSCIFCFSKRCFLILIHVAILLTIMWNMNACNGIWKKLSSIISVCNRRLKTVEKQWPSIETVLMSIAESSGKLRKLIVLYMIQRISKCWVLEKLKTSWCCATSKNQVLYRYLIFAEHKKVTKLF